MDFNKDINNFYKNIAPKFKKPIEKLIKLFIKDATYKDGSSLETHDLNNNTIKLKDVPSDINNSKQFNKELLKCICLNKNNKSRIELLWGDIQLGKRVHACIISWISIRIYGRGVLYIFRNLNIDKEQFKNDINRDKEYDFNCKYIKKIFNDFDNSIKDYWTDYELPDLECKNINIDFNPINNDSMKRRMVGALMNSNNLEIINNKLNDYINKTSELLNITLIVDECDLFSPTSHNNKDVAKDLKDTAKCEKLLSQIYKKVNYTLLITGTGHSLLSNFTTSIEENEKITLKISKVFKMNRNNKDYYGIFNNKININTNEINKWWNTKNKYMVEKDYDINIKNIIRRIIERDNMKYNSLLISEDVITKNQDKLKNLILKDFSNLFLIIYNGKNLNIYIPNLYIKYFEKYLITECDELKKEVSSIKKRIEDEDNYMYYEIKVKKYNNINIKKIYKVFSIFFKKINKKINKTVVTITGKYGERGYSFTSDDFENHTFHLTDQYLIGRGGFNGTNVLQKIRLQGKYKEVNAKLTLWTSDELNKLLMGFFVPLMLEIEKYIMKYKNEEIYDFMKALMYTKKINEIQMHFIDPMKKLKNILSKDKIKYLKLFNINNLDNYEINNKIYQCLPKFTESINEIKIKSKDNFLKDNCKCIKPEKFRITNLNKEIIDKYIKKVNKCFSKVSSHFIKDRQKLLNNKQIIKEYVGSKKKEKILLNSTTLLYIHKKNIFTKNHRRLKIAYDENNNMYLIILYIEVSENINYISKLENYKNSEKKPYFEDSNKVIYTQLKEENKPIDWYIKNTHYFITPENNLYLCLNKVSHIENNNEIEIENKIIRDFCFENIIDTDEKELRYGIQDIYKKYIEWCNEKQYKNINRKSFKEQFEQKYKYLEKKGKNKKGESGKRGYNLDFN
jgi:hypothetical protein